MSSSLPSNKTQVQWQEVYKWLQFTLEKNSSGVGITTGRLVMGSTNYKLSAIKHHHASGLHDEVA